MERREFAGLVMSLTTGSILVPLLSKASATETFYDLPFTAGLPDKLPANIQQMVKNTLNYEFKAVNT